MTFPEVGNCFYLSKVDNKFMVVSSDEERICRNLKLSIVVSSDEDRIPMAHFWKSYTAKLDLTSEL